jgi:hypothetical protein
MDRNTKNQLRKPKIMTKIEMDAENDKTTKNFDRYKMLRTIKPPRTLTGTNSRMAL